MADNPTTKRFINALRKDGGLSTRRDFLIPDLSAKPDGFVSLKNGKRHKRGAVVFLGQAIGVEDILCRMDVRQEDSAQNDLLARFVALVAQLPLGALVEAEYSCEDNLTLPVVAEETKPGRGQKLP